MLSVPSLDFAVLTASLLYCIWRYKIVHNIKIITDILALPKSADDSECQHHVAGSLKELGGLVVCSVQ